MTRPVSTIPAASSPCPATSGHLRLNASDHAPAGTSVSVSVTATTVPRPMICDADNRALTTK